MRLKVLETSRAAMTGDSVVLVMASGGGDSTALLVRAMAGEIDLPCERGRGHVDPRQVVALHVNHGIRGPEADRDEAFVASLCDELGVSLVIRHVDIPGIVARIAQGRSDGFGWGCDVANLEEVARVARYSLAWEEIARLSVERGTDPACARVLVAHTADERAETMLMRLTTGAAASGLVGIRETQGLVSRPLLRETRADLRGYLRQRGIGWCEDATNDDVEPLRGFVRHRVMPILRERNPRVELAIGRALDVLCQEDDLLERMAAELMEQALANVGGSSPVPVELDAETLRRAEPALARRTVPMVLEMAMGAKEMRRARVERRHIDEVLDVLWGRRTSANLPLGAHARLRSGRLVIEAGKADGPQACADAVELPVPGKAAWGGFEITSKVLRVPADEDAVAIARQKAREADASRSGDGACRRALAVFDAELAGVANGGALMVGGPAPGLRMEPLGLQGRSKLVRDVLADAHVPARERELVPVVCKRTVGVGCGDVVWVAGIRPDGRFACSTGTRVLLQLQLVPKGT